MKIIGIVFGLLFLTSCADRGPNLQITVPEIVDYNEDFRSVFAVELGEICGNPTAGVIDPYPKSCVFIRDQIELRKQIREIENLNNNI